MMERSDGKQIGDIPTRMCYDDIESVIVNVEVVDATVKNLTWPAILDKSRLRASLWKQKIVSMCFCQNYLSNGVLRCKRWVTLIGLGYFGSPTLTVRVVWTLWVSWYWEATIQNTGSKATDTPGILQGEIKASDKALERQVPGIHLVSWDTEDTQ